MIPIFYSLDTILNDWFDSANTSGSMLVENDRPKKKLLKLGNLGAYRRIDLATV